MCLEIKYLIYMYMYKKDLASNNLQWLIRHKTKPNQTFNWWDIAAKKCELIY